jgi:hypothetical protein
MAKKIAYHAHFLYRHLFTGVEFPYWTSYFGAGRLIDSENFEFKTSQFSLFKLFYERALIDPQRTLDPSAAVSFLIPYDMGNLRLFTLPNQLMNFQIA